MDLDKKKLEELCKIAKEAALCAGMIIKEAQAKELKVYAKEGGENIASCVVTEIDLNAEKAIVETLTPTLKKYDIGLLTEETTDDNSRFEKDYFWCIDPLDGTLCFSRNEEGYSTSIALIAKDGTPVIGVVYSPKTDDLYHAVKNCGAYKNNQKLTISNDAKDVTLLYDQSYLKYPKYLEQIEKLKKDLKEMGYEDLNDHHLGGAVMNGLMTIEMAPALYYKFPKESLGGGSLWDFAASSVIQSEAGAFNSDYYQNPLDLNRNDSTFMNHRGVIYCSKKDLLPLIPKVD
jgi:fructose-1,6-bisphosphatase/inositol monophosphatase family enzyme